MDHFNADFHYYFSYLSSNADPVIDIKYLATFAILIALAGSFQDIAIDAFRIELAGIEEQGNLAAYYQFGYRGAILTATSFALIYAENYSGEMHILDGCFNAYRANCLINYS